MKVQSERCVAADGSVVVGLMLKAQLLRKLRIEGQPGDAGEGSGIVGWDEL